MSKPTTIPTTKRADYARDHLANDRTYLAWVRTALNVIILGLVVAKFVDSGDPTEARVAGLLLVVTGVSLLAYGTYRAQRTGNEIDHGRYAIHRRGTILVSTLLLGAVVATVLILF